MLQNSSYALSVWVADGPSATLLDKVSKVAYYKYVLLSNLTLLTPSAVLAR